MTADTRVTIGFAKLGSQDKFVSTAPLLPSQVFKVSGTSQPAPQRLIRAVDQRQLQDLRHRIAEAQVHHDAAEASLGALQAREGEVRAAHAQITANHVRRPT